MTNVRIYFLSRIIQKCIMKAWSFKYSNIANLVCILFLFSCYFISKYIITCILIIINAILMSFRWMAGLMVLQCTCDVWNKCKDYIYERNNCIKTYERFIKIWLNKGHFSRTITQLLHRPGVCESVSNGIAQNKKCTVILINSE